MHPRFAELIESLHPKFLQLMEMEPFRFDTLPRVLPKRAIYLFSEGDDHLYVGRTNNLRSRLSNHCRETSKHNKAAFAFRIARQQTGQVKATYTKEGSRSQLENDDVFGPAFVAAKERLRLMDLRFVEEVDPVRQALLEIYTATVLQTPYNDFENH